MSSILQVAEREDSSERREGCYSLSILEPYMTNTSTFRRADSGPAEVIA